MASFQKLAHYEKAVNHFSKALERRPGFIEAYIQRGRVYKKMGKFDLAISDYTQATRLTRRPHEAYCGRGLVYAAKVKLTRQLRILPPLYTEAAATIGTIPKHITIEATLMSPKARLPLQLRTTTLQ